MMKEKDPGRRHSYLTQSPQVLQDLTVETTTWIAQMTGYAIFSHRWLDMGELTFQDISKFKTLSVPGFQMLIDHKSDRKILRGTDILDQVNAYSPENPKNCDNRFKLLEVMKELCGDMSDEERRHCQDFVKLVEFFNISLKYGCHYVWFDSGCIDKSSSTELEESIRSMFNWYRNSEICIVHLADTTYLSLDLDQDPWFTRGWTLQKLLAPKRIAFFGKSWEHITRLTPDNDKDLNTESKVTLWKIISSTTNIPLPTLLDFTPGINHAGNALFWVSKRKTTRIEDIAYCLIGLLGIPLSIAYGEGNMAFRRLQVEILQHTHDMGLFAWIGQPSAYNSMLAEGPECFSQSSLQSHLQPLPVLPKSGTVFDPTYAFTNYGLRIPLSIYSVLSWEVWHAPNSTFSLRVEELGNIQAQLIVKSPNLEDYSFLKIAILADLVTRVSSASIAILLGWKDGRYKRIPTKQHIILSRANKLTASQMIFIE